MEAHEVQLVNYITGAKIEVGLLLNFGAGSLQIKRRTFWLSTSHRGRRFPQLLPILIIFRILQSYLKLPSPMPPETILETPDSVTRAAQQLEKAQAEGGPLGETLTLNMGPSHPSTHGVLRILLELDGEIVTSAMPDIGYLHRGDEKIAENMTYNQFVPYTDRLDYLAPLANNVAYALAVEKLMGWTVPSARPGHPRHLLRARAHLRAPARHGRARHGHRRDDLLPLRLHRARENLQPHRVAHRRALHHQLHPHRRPDPRPAARLGKACAAISPSNSRARSTSSTLSSPATKSSSIATRASASSRKEDAIDFGLTGPNLRGSGVSYDLRKDQSPTSPILSTASDIPTGSTGDALRSLSRPSRGIAPKRPHHRAGAAHLPGGPINVADGKVHLPAEGKSPHQDGGADPPIHPRHRRHPGARRRSLLRRGKSERANSASISRARAAAYPTG